MNIFQTWNICQAIRELSDESGKTFREIAEQSRIHASYFSRVMVGKANFSEEQAFLIGQALGLDGEELEYFLLLNQYAKSSGSAFQAHIKKKLIEKQAQNTKVINRLAHTGSLDEPGSETYYADPITAMVHMGLTIACFRREPLSLGNKIGITPSRLHVELTKLQRLGLIARQDKDIALLQRRVHLDAESTISPRNHINWRLETIHHLSRRFSPSDDYHLSVLFSSNEAARYRIKQLFLDFVVQAQNESSMDNEAKEIYHMGFDFYKL
jgi:hypothetical protein